MTTSVFPVFDSSSLPFVEQQFALYRQNPAHVDTAWQAYFAGWLAAGAGSSSAAEVTSGDLASYMFCNAWREFGYLVADVNPLAKPTDVPALLRPETYGLDEAGLNDECRNVRASYSATTGIECMAVNDLQQRAWVQAWWEKPANRGAPQPEIRKAALKQLVQANAFEKFLHTKFVGAKRFSVEGNDALLAMLGWLAQAGMDAEVRHMVVGMAHRGRLNVLCNTFHKPLNELLAAFGDTLETSGGPASGDVKYHMGKTYVMRGATGGEIQLDLLFNPSHLEAVNPVVLGQARAFADTGREVLPVLVHGDSAVIGQGVVAETYNLAGLPAYNVGGCIHIVTNNQIGFTANGTDAYSGKNCTDGFRMTGGPIVHVNADDTDACIQAVRFAWEYRERFGADVMLDMVGYRRWGHNEGDDPTFTQPLMYNMIKDHPVAAEIYGAKLVADGVMSQADVKAVEDAYTAELNAAFSEAKAGMKVKAKVNPALASESTPTRTAVEQPVLNEIAAAWQAVPAGVVVNSKVAKVLDERVAALGGTKPFNWGAAETAAYGSLLMQGVSVRMTGQDVQRGTFSHRHAVLTCQDTANTWSPLESLARKGSRLTVINSALSEYAVMGFEYGYSLGAPDALTIWEGQFGDFANGAQIIIDQFLASAATKWGQANNLALLLPHGYEGQGPEHSSGRLERFLQLAAEDNMSICYPSTPAQVFHVLRRQALRKQRKPLVVMTPKSGLRNPAAVSDATELTNGSFQTVIADALAGKNVKKAVLCSGKVYYDLLARRTELNDETVALIRVEELYPWPAKAVAEALKAYKVRDVYWVQEEPRNMGAWWFVREQWDDSVAYLHYLGRPNSASPAAGTTRQHAAEQAAILASVFGDKTADKKAA